MVLFSITFVSKSMMGCVVLLFCSEIQIMNGYLEYVVSVVHVLNRGLWFGFGFYRSVSLKFHELQFITEANLDCNLYLHCV